MKCFGQIKFSELKKVVGELQKQERRPLTIRFDPLPRRSASVVAYASEEQATRPGAGEVVARAQFVSRYDHSLDAEV